MVLCMAFGTVSSSVVQMIVLPHDAPLVSALAMEGISALTAEMLSTSPLAERYNIPTRKIPVGHMAMPRIAAGTAYNLRFGSTASALSDLSTATALSYTIMMLPAPPGAIPVVAIFLVFLVILAQANLPYRQILDMCGAQCNPGGINTRDFFISRGMLCNLKN